MMNKLDKKYVDNIETWRQNKGKGTILVSKDDYLHIISTIISKIYIRSPTTKTVIICDNFTLRTNLYNSLDSAVDDNVKEIIHNSLMDKRIKIITTGYIDFMKRVPEVNLFIACDIASVTNNITSLLVNSKFKLVLLDKIIQDTEERLVLYKYAPMISVVGEYKAIEDKLSSPVKEYRMPIAIVDNEILEDITKADKYISQSMSIFNDFFTLEKARSGDKKNNISSAIICNQIANANGWNEHLDMDIPFNKEIDAVFNPIVLKERASVTYDIIRHRSKILADYKDKKEKVYEIVNDLINNNYCNILIFSKHGEFAKEITTFINDKFPILVCGDYHDKLDKIPAYNEKGEPLFIKSGAKAGSRRYIGAQAQCTINERLFRENRLKVLSCSSAPNKSLSCTVDAVIITSPFCGDLSNFLYRLNNVDISKTPLPLYNIYCADSLEERQIKTQSTPNNYEIVNESEINVNYDENVGVVFAD